MNTQEIEERIEFVRNKLGAKSVELAEHSASVKIIFDDVEKYDAAILATPREKIIRWGYDIDDKTYYLIVKVV